MSTFTIPFPEYDIANILQKEFPKKDNFSVAIPLSRQQKFYDLLLINGESKKSVTIQVKSSRTYLGSEKSEYQYYSWLNYFDIKDNYSDFYFYDGHHLNNYGKRIFSKDLGLEIIKVISRA